MKHTVTLEIAGTKFRLVADADAHHLSELAALVNERVGQLGSASKSASSAQLLALVALGLADDLTNSEKKLREVDKLTRSTLRNVIARIDSRLAQAPELAQAEDSDDTPAEPT